MRTTIKCMGMLFVSDIHFGANRREDVDAFMHTAADEVRGDALVVIVGDLTQNATNEEYDEAGVFLAELVNMGLRLVVTVGNHDLGGWRGERLGMRPCARKRFIDLLKVVHAQPELIAANELDAIYRVGADVFVSLASSHRGRRLFAGLAGGGRIRRGQIEWCRRELDRAGIDGIKDRLHLVTHRSVFSDVADKHRPMHRHERLDVELLAPRFFASVVSGHNHRAVAAKVALPTSGHIVTRVSVPTLSTRVQGTDQHRGWLVGALSSEELPRLVSLPSLTTQQEAA
jgi:3',5'-cyclic AMP phosphodiesterase CpdA